VAAASQNAQRSIASTRRLSARPSSLIVHSTAAYHATLAFIITITPAIAATTAMPTRRDRRASEMTANCAART
jgi:hypothetical protein